MRPSQIRNLILLAVLLVLILGSMSTIANFGSSPKSVTAEKAA